MIRSSRLIAVVFILLFSVGVGVLLYSFKPDEVTVLTPTRDIKPYESINPKTDFKEVDVRENKDKAMAKNEVTPEWLADQIKKASKSDQKLLLFASTPLRPDERIDNRNMVIGESGGLSIVKPGERVVAVNVTLAGSAAAIVQPGDVVSITEGDAGTQLDNVKVVAFGPGLAVTQDVTGRGSSNQDTSAGGLLALIALPADQAADFSGKTVTMVYNPFCKSDENGDIVPSGDAKASECETSNTSNAATTNEATTNNG